MIVHLPNLLGYPAWFYDEGAYLTASLQWLQTGVLEYYGHPFGPLAVLAAMFAIVNPTNYLAPRILMVILSVIDGIVLFRTTQLVYPGASWLPIFSALLFEATPLSARYLRLTVVDNFLSLFLMLSLLFLFWHPSRWPWSALAYGGALISKQTGLFFLPAFLLLLCLKQKRSSRQIIGWLGIAAILPALWILYGTVQLGLSSVISQQFELTGLGGERAVSAVSLIVQRISTRDPFIWFGLAGILWAAYKRKWMLLAFPVIYYASFVVLFLKISTVYLIPTLPFLSILAAVLLTDLASLTPKLKNSKALQKSIFAVLIIGLTGSSIFLVVSQSPSTSQQAALDYISGLSGPPVVVVSYTYLWLIQQNYPNILAYDRYATPWSTLHGEYLILDLPGDLVTVNSIPGYQTAYNGSIIVASYNYSGYLVQVRQATI